MTAAPKKRSAKSTRSAATAPASRREGTPEITTRWRPQGAAPREQSQYERRLKATIKRAEAGDTMASDQLLAQFVDVVADSVKAAELYPGLHVRLLAYFARAFDSIRRYDTPADVALGIRRPANRPPVTPDERLQEDMRIAVEYHRQNPRKVGAQVARDGAGHVLGIGGTRIKDAIRRTGLSSRLVAIKRGPKGRST